MPEDTYGNVKRLAFIKAAILKYGAKRVLDIGCGTGEKLTMPLASMFPNVQFVAIDSDPKTIEYAKQRNQKSNLEFISRSDENGIGSFEIVIASEVLEHVENPIEFIKSLRGYLSGDAVVVLTLPNGYGPFELASFIESIFYFCGGYKLVRIFKKYLAKSNKITFTNDTLATSPHINFFSYKEINSLIKSNGFCVNHFQPRTFLCGFIFDHIIRTDFIIKWNVDISDRLPAQLASAWMFVLSRTGEEGSEVIVNNIYTIIRRSLNKLRWRM